MATKDDPTQARGHFFHFTPGRFVLALLAIAFRLFLSQ
jgi:hypothetical protein